MNGMRKLAVATSLLLLGIASSASNARAQTIKDIAGMYTLVSAIVEQGGKKTETYGSGATGALTSIRAVVTCRCSPRPISRNLSPTTA